MTLRILITVALLSVGPSLRLSAQLLDSARTRLAKLEGEIRAPGLDSAVEVRRDR